MRKITKDDLFRTLNQYAVGDINTTIIRDEELNQVLLTDCDEDGIEVRTDEANGEVLNLYSNDAPIHIIKGKVNIDGNLYSFYKQVPVDFPNFIY